MPHLPALPTPKSSSPRLWGPLAGLALLAGACVDGPVDQDGDGHLPPQDCILDDPTSHPGAWEVCDGRDNDCDGAVDELYDLDGDGWLADDAGCRAMGAVPDCDDLDPAVHPDAAEAQNGLDDDCDGVTDDSPDVDGDGWGAFDDCDDADPFVHPEAPDACDGLDNDCDGAADEDHDVDGDGFSPCSGDCDEADPANAEGLPEVCDDGDNDCDGAVDEGFDADGDGFTSCQGDCDDARTEVHPGAPEVCNGLDDDCDPSTDEATDQDGDGFTFCDGDCDDAQALAIPGGTEACDGVDNDCDGVVDDGLAACRCSEVGLLGAWSFTGSLEDETGHGWDAVAYGGASLTSDRYDRRESALYLDGVDGYAETGLDSNRYPMSFSAWFRADSVRGERSIVDSDVGGSWGQSLILGYQDSDGDLDVQVHDGWFDSGHRPEAGTWIHAAVVFSDPLQLWLDGILVLEEPYVPTSMDGATLRFGRHNAADPQWFQGAVDDVRVYDCALEPDEILALAAE